MDNWTDDLNQELDRIQKDFPHLAPSRAFILWFLSAYHNLPEQEALGLLTDNPSDKTIDAVYVDDRQHIVFVHQSKYTANYGQSAFSYEDLKIFAAVKDYFRTGSGECLILKWANPSVRRLLPYAFECFNQRGWPLELVFFTTHKDNFSATEEIQEILKDFSNAKLSVFPFQRIKSLFRDWQEDAIPRIGEINLKFSSSEILKREHAQNRIKSIVVSVPATHIASIFKKWGNDLLSRNVREFLGRTKKANQGIRKTLREKPHRFWYYNNGITMTSEKIEINDAENTATLRNPQIINGGQTVRIIGELNTQGAEVLTRIVQVPEDDEGRNFVQEMIAANNTQSPVDWVDLRANHPYQVALQRSLMREGWFFERKKREYDRKSKEIGYQFDFYYPNGVIKNVDLAQAIIAIKKNPNEAKEGADRIFEQQFDFVFKPGQDVYDFILAHQINEILRSSSRSTNVKNVDGRFSEERPMVYKHARLHALHLIFHYGNILRRKTEGKKALSKQLKEADSQATDIFDIMAHEVLSLCYQAWREGNMDAIDLFKEKETLQRLKDNFPKRNSRRIHNSINKIVTNN